MAQQKQLLTSYFDIAQHGWWRILRHWFLQKTSTMGNFGGGPGLLCLGRLMVLHYFGGPVYWCKLRLEAQPKIRQLAKRILRR